MSPSEFLRSQWDIDGLIEPSDTVLLHSNVFPALMKLRQAGYAPEPENVLTALIDLWPNGTVLLPTFNFGFAAGEPYDLKTVPSQMGRISEIARHMKESVRTWHPLYSFCVIGNRSSEFENLRNRSGLGADSPFELLREIGGKIGFLDIQVEECLTFVHHVEETEGVNYRYLKSFSGKYSGDGQIFTDETFEMFVRDIENNVVTDISGLARFLSEQRLFLGSRRYAGNGLALIDSNLLYNTVSEIIQTDRSEGMLYQRNAK
tara:strand:+ start:508 stop:1290 length:783 start_codon:yes stop_codon:yes gene_type:complete